MANRLLARNFTSQRANGLLISWGDKLVQRAVRDIRRNANNLNVDIVIETDAHVLGSVDFLGDVIIVFMKSVLEIGYVHVSIRVKVNEFWIVLLREVVYFRRVALGERGLVVNVRRYSVG